MMANKERKIEPPTNPSKKPPKNETGTKRTPLEDFVEGFPIDLAKQALSTNLAELFRGATSRPI